jgi:hypothetical protein
MNRINLFQTKKVLSTPSRITPATLDSVSWGKTNFDKTASTVAFAAVLIVCSIGVGCSSDKPVSTNNQPVMTEPTPPAVTTPTSAPAAPELQAAAKPVHKKIVHKAPVNATYADKTSGVSFQYPRKYLRTTGDAAGEMVSSDPATMDFVQPGGVAVAAVAIPETVYPKSDLASAFFDVSVNKALTVEQCGEFTGGKPGVPADTAAPATVPPSKRMIGDMELQSTETLASNGSRQEAAKYFHGFANGACYEFALKVATGVETDEGGKHVDRGEVFQRLEKILATVKINPVTAPEVAASAPVTSTASTPATPAQ